MRRLTLPLILGLSHGVADGAAGLLLGGLPRVLPIEQVALLLLLYNALAFGGQPLAGLITDRVGRPRGAALTGLLLLGAALLLGARQPQLAVTLAGLGSAAFHVGGGALAVCATRGRAAGPGLFAAPGVVGLAVGGALAAAGYTAVWPFLLLLLALAGAITLFELPVLPYATTTDPRDKVTRRQGDKAIAFDGSITLSPLHPVTDPRGTVTRRQGDKVNASDNSVTLSPLHPVTVSDESVVGGQSSVVGRQSSVVDFEGHDLVMLVLLAGIALRSLVWSSLQYLLAGRVDILLALAVAAAAGKILGGVLADRIGWRRWAAGALALAAPLLALGEQSLFALLPGVMLLQSATPVALAASARLLPRAPATAAGLTLGLAVAIGGVLPAGGLSPMITSPPAVAAMLLAAALALWWALRQHCIMPLPSAHSAVPPLPHSN